MKKLYAMYDRKSESYGPVFACGHDALAVRELGGGMKNEQSVFAQYPDDFELRCVGEYYDDGVPPGQVLAVVGLEPEVVMTCRQWLDAQPGSGVQKLSLAQEA